MEFECKICGNFAGNKFYNVREMQFGTRDEFVYCECSDCGCLQLVNPPENLSKYYPREYFSFSIPKEKFIKKKLHVYRDRYAFGIKSFPGKILFNKYGAPTYIGWMRNLRVNLNSKILDVGCGTGKLLRRMGDTGFTDLTGVDAFIGKDISYSNGVKIYKKNLDDVSGDYDLIMMHHSLEHMDNQHKVFKKLSKLLCSNKFLFIRIPTCSSFAWRTYKENWFALEAPRHFFNHSIKSLRFLADKYGFDLVKIEYDSRSIQLWGSEQYMRNIQLMDEKSYFVNPDNSIFTNEQIEKYEEKTKKLNEEKDGDQVCVYLRKRS